MSKFLYLQDLHFSGRNSTFYISDYFKDCLEMLDEILNIASKEKCEAILDGGDLLDTAEPSYRILDEIADRVEKTKIPIYSLFGNHAQLYHSLEHSRYTGLSHLQKRSELFKYLNQDFGIKECNIKGYEYNHSIEEELKHDGIIVEGNKDTWKIAIVHAFICPKKFPYASHVVCDDIKTNADIVLVAHYHAEWEKKVGNTLFKDIGCIGRRSITEKNINPKILIIDTDKREIKEVLLKSAKQPEEIFDLTKVDEIKEMDNNIDTFIKSLEDVQFQGIDTKERIKFAAKELKSEKTVVDCLINKIEEIKNES